MSRRAALLLGLLAVIYGLLFSAPGYSQDAPIAKRCSPPLKLLQLSAPTASSQTERASPKVLIERIEFDGPIHLLDSAVAQIIADFNKGHFTANKSWLDQFVEIGLRGAWQNQGYFRVKATAQAHSLGGDSNEERFLVTAHVDEGLRYHLGELRFVSEGPGTAFSEKELQ